MGQRGGLGMVPAKYSPRIEVEVILAFNYLLAELIAMHK
jgi:hypothetical protein